MGARLRNYFLAGILVTAPIAITLYFAWSMVDYVDSRVTALLPERYNPSTYLHVAIPGLGVIILVLALTLIGFLTANFLGRLMLRLGEGVVSRMPVIRNIYSALKQIFETVLSNRAQSFSEVVLVEFPRKEMWTLGLVVGPAYGEVSEKAGAEMFNVFVPTTPNPTSGYLVFVPRSQMMKLEMTVEDCLKMIISGGIVTPRAENARDS
ncbi:MAG: DUF502 domain-containing protein [Rhodospirillaceae bacterium]|nr:DUF502 domain-containing protein [Rhodospirillaceae bacterium]